MEIARQGAIVLAYPNSSLIEISSADEAVAFIGTLSCCSCAVVIVILSEMDKALSTQYTCLYLDGYGKTGSIETFFCAAAEIISRNAVQTGRASISSCPSVRRGYAVQYIKANLAQSWSH